MIDKLLCREYCYTCKKKHSVWWSHILCDFVGRFEK